MHQSIGLETSVAVLLLAFANDARARELAEVGYAANTPCPLGCSSPDGKRLQAAFDSSQTRPNQKQKMLQIIGENTASGITNWPTAARLYFMICPLLSGPISILGMATKEEWNGKEAQAGRHHRQAA